MSEEGERLLNGSGIPIRTRYFVYTVMVAFGLTSLLPWNIIITAHGYYAVKLNETHVNYITEHFPSYFQIVGIGSHFLLSLSAVSFLKLGNLSSCIYQSNCVILFIFILTSLFPLVNTSYWAVSFFGLSLVLFGASLALSAVYMSAMMGLSVLLTPNAVQGFYLGQGVAGLFAACLSLITLSMPHADPVTAGFYYFLVTSVYLAVSLLAFFFFNRNEFVRSSVRRASEQEHASSLHLNKDETLRQPGTIVLSVFKSIKKFCFVTTMTSTITSTCFPAALSTLVSTDTTQDSMWVSTFFLPVVAFLFFALGDVLGRVTSSFILVPSRKYLLPVASLRLLLIPLIFTCNLQPRGAWLPVLFHNDIAPAIFTLTLSWSNGHLQSLAAYYAPLQLDLHRDKATASSLIAFSYSSGLLSGSVLVFILCKLLNL